MGLDNPRFDSGQRKNTFPSPVHPDRFCSSSNLFKGHRGYFPPEKKCGQGVKLIIQIRLVRRFSTPATWLHGVDTDNFIS